jgi:hypothetical protein
MRTQSQVPKEMFLYSATSNSVSRINIVNCIKEKFVETDFITNLFGEVNQTRLEQEDYYKNIANARVGLAMPGIGYDTFRLLIPLHQ